MNTRYRSHICDTTPTEASSWENIDLGVTHWGQLSLQSLLFRFCCQMRFHRNKLFTWPSHLPDICYLYAGTGGTVDLPRAIIFFKIFWMFYLLPRGMVRAWRKFALSDKPWTAATLNLYAVGVPNLTLCPLSLSSPCRVWVPAILKGWFERVLVGSSLQVCCHVW